MKLIELLTRKKNPRHDHAEEKLQQQEEVLEDYARRLRRLELEAGIHKPPLRRVGR